MVVLEPFEADELEELHGSPPLRRADPAGDLAPDDRIGEDRAPRQQAVGLKHETAVAARAAHRAPVEQHVARACRLEPGHDAQERGLAAAGRADHRDELALLDGEIDLLQRCKSPKDLPRRGLELRRHGA